MNKPAIIAGAVALAIVASVGAQAQTPTPTPGGDCCSIHAGPSCDIQACADCICIDEEEPLCCLDGGGGWDEFCLGLAFSDLCRSECGCGPDVTPTPTPGGDCCSAHDSPSCDDAACVGCVCDMDNQCCDNLWDATCVSIARNVEECASACSICTPLPTPVPEATPTPGDCCEPRPLNDPNPGCNENRCESCVCGEDPVCCNDTWDETCISVASAECALDCVCDEDSACCEAHEGPGCNERNCQDCVVALDPGCAESWDAQCVSEASVECALECPCGDCCADQGDIPGCGVKACQSCVCEIDPDCCNLGWDGQCDSIARDECAIDCPCGDCCTPQAPGSEIVGCGEKICQECVCAFDDECCELEWDGFCADQARGECDRRCECEAQTSNCCEAREGESGCELSACEACVCNEDSFCCNEGWDNRCATELTAVAACAADCMCTAPPDCAGDCDGDGSVSVSELIRAVNIALGNLDISQCTAIDGNGDGTVSINELIRAVNAALTGC